MNTELTLSDSVRQANNSHTNRLWQGFEQALKTIADWCRQLCHERHIFSELEFNFRNALLFKHCLDYSGNANKCPGFEFQSRLRIKAYSSIQPPLHKSI